MPDSKELENQISPPEKIRFYATEQLSENISETPEGFLICLNVPISRTGEFIYRSGEVPVRADASGIIRILREAEDVFDEISVLSFEGKSATVNHPPKGTFVEPENWKELTVGICQNVHRGSGSQQDLLMADLLITDAKAIELVKEGLREISCGYDADYEEIEPGKGRQHNIVGNHVALVAKGRAGGRCAIGDSACTGCGKCNCNSKEDEETMKTMAQKMTEVRNWLNRFPAFDSEETEEEKAAREAEEKKTKDSASQAKGFRDSDEEEEFKQWQKEKANDKKTKDGDDDPEDPEKQKKPEDDGKKKTEDKKTKDEEEQEKLEKEAEEKRTQDKKTRDADMDDIKERLSNLETLLKSLISDDGPATEDKKTKDTDDPDGKKKTDVEKAESDKTEEDKQKTEDAWTDLSYRAEILFPGINLRKPTRDHASTFRSLKIAAMKGASLRSASSGAMKAFAKGRSYDSMSDQEIDNVFLGASELLINLNNASIQKPSNIKTTDANNMRMEIATINARNKDFWQSGK